MCLIDPTKPNKAQQRYKTDQIGDGVRYISLIECNITLKPHKDIIYYLLVGMVQEEKITMETKVHTSN